MKKQVPLEQEGPIVSPDPVDELFSKIYNENPEYWKYGLSKELFNGHGDKIFLLNEKGKPNKVIGFVGIQKYRPDNEGKMVHGLSVGLLPEYRGKGFARKSIISLLPKLIDKNDNTDILWACNSRNTKSAKLFAALHDAGVIKNNFRLQFD